VEHGHVCGAWWCSSGIMTALMVAFIWGRAMWIMVSVTCGSISQSMVVFIFGRSSWLQLSVRVLPVVEHGYFKTFIFGRIPMSTFALLQICAAFFS
jgi:hypothetical protein